LTRNPIEKQCVEILKTTFSQLPHLQELVLFNSLRNFTIEEVCSLLDVPTLKVLELGLNDWNNFKILQILEVLLQKTS